MTGDGDKTIDRCPACGSTRGWTITITVRETYTASWGSPPAIPPEKHAIRSSKNATCLDCGKRVGRWLAIGGRKTA